ncbi:hypothetical protein HKX69_05890 [Streptomyces argyrophyllae]|uniref:Uncharacterized protein n=1 Tax=Streptomyces argyrophylli TaxID=2726118 RepID=A0A6M4PDF4_9ACTN|nr:hypothetical protein [Streptomyces argyrophyllae]QJS09105.1 hypothetical protein HKX69_05890 [Streptomyces argyrophyllae]
MEEKKSTKNVFSVAKGAFEWVKDHGTWDKQADGTFRAAFAVESFAVNVERTPAGKIKWRIGSPDYIPGQAKGKFRKR